VSTTPPDPAPWQAELAAIVGARQGGAAAALLPRLRDLDTRYPDTAEILAQLAWTSEVLGRYRDAAGYYERALALGLPPNATSDALLGLGSALRCLGEFDRAEKFLQQGRAQFPDRREFDAFLALTLHNLGRHAEALQLLLSTLVETTEDIGITAYGRTLRFHAGQLDRRWD
jgi:tetratricopeptide (TPR) repeat protein